MSERASSLRSWLLLAAIFILVPQIAHAHGGVGGAAVLMLAALLPLGLVVGTAFYFLIARRFNPSIKTWAQCVGISTFLLMGICLKACETELGAHTELPATGTSTTSRLR